MGLNYDPKQEYEWTFEIDLTFRSVVIDTIIVIATIIFFYGEIYG